MQAKHAQRGIQSPAIDSVFLNARDDLSSATGNVQRPAARRKALTDHRLLDATEQETAVQSRVSLKLLE